MQSVPKESWSDYSISDKINCKTKLFTGEKEEFIVVI